MNTQIVAIVISEGAKLLGQYYRNRPITLKQPSPLKVVETRATGGAGEEPLELEVGSPAPAEEPDWTPAEGQATKIATGCVPCAIGHLGTCSGLLKESIRFAKDGIDTDEVIDRVGMCLDELNAMERVDLQPSMLVQLPEWEKALAQEALLASRATRHALEAFSTVDALEQTAANTSNLRTTIFRRWIKQKMEHLTPEERVRIQTKVNEKLGELTPKEV